MDQDVAKTLGELERKLLELERTLTAIGHDEGPGEQPAGQCPQFASAVSGRCPQ